jgi:hypothetical protein
MTNSPFLLVTSALALLLFGVNLAFLTNLGAKVVPWFRFKIAAVSMMLVYIACSLSLGNPDNWRAGIGLVALVVDVCAVGWMWHSVNHYRERKIVGLVPLILGEDNHQGMDPRI